MIMMERTFVWNANDSFKREMGLLQRQPHFRHNEEYNIEVIRMIYVIRCGRDYICKGSYVVQGAKYKVIGGIEEARKFKTEDAAQREAKRLNNSYKYENISDDCAVVKIE